MTECRKVICHSRKGGNPGTAGRSSRPWTPAFAGVKKSTIALRRASFDTAASRPAQDEELL